MAAAAAAASSVLGGLVPVRPGHGKSKELRPRGVT
jgi:hypothetical protein